MQRPAKSAAWVAVGFGVLVAAGCASNSESSTPSASASDPASCLIGSWVVNNTEFADAADDVLENVAGGTLTGDVGLGFTNTVLTTTYSASLTAKAPAPDGTPDSALKIDMRGGSTADYSANASTMLLSGGSSSIVLTATSTANGVTRTIQDVKPYEPLVSFTTGTLAYTCNNGSLFLTNQAGMVLTATRKT